MRRILMASLSALVLSLLVLGVVALASTPESNATAIALPTPTVTSTLPACVTEDGAGQALCWWDAAKQGNGQGTSVVSGDCAPSIMGQDTSALCVNLYSRQSETITNADGGSNTIPNGADLVGECTMEFDGIELQECIKEWLKN